mgnify:CR=1 FL=1
MPCNYRANGCNVWMSVHAERNLSYAKIIYIIKKSKFGKDVLKYFKTPGSQIAHKHLRCATRRSRPASRLPGWERRAGAEALSRTAKAATGERQHNSLAVNAL